MLTRRIIPCLDIRDGRVVKGIKFQGLRDAGDPVECAARYESDGADELVFLDVSATNEGRKAALETVAAVRRALSIPLTVGGGIRSVDDARALLEAGADKVSLNSAAVSDPALIGRISGSFGVQCTVLAVDAAHRIGGGGQEVVVRSGTLRTGLELVDWVCSGVDRGAGEILLTSFDRDGTREGYDLDTLRAVCSAVRVPVIASGGADSAEHMRDAFEAGADAVLAASIFHDHDVRVVDLKRQLAAFGLPIRP